MLTHIGTALTEDDASDGVAEATEGIADGAAFGVDLEEEIDVFESVGE